MKAKDIMSPDPVCVTPDTGVRDAARIMQRQNVGVVPVVADVSSKRLLGLITDRDIAIRVVAEARGPDVRVSDVMTQGVTTARPDDSVDEILQRMGREQVRRIPVVDETGAIVGIVAQADLATRAPDDRKVEHTIEQISQPTGKSAN
jgi:CBS domain-containing protein